MIDSLLKIVFPPRCIVCKKNDTLLCDECSKNLRFEPKDYVCYPFIYAVSVFQVSTTLRLIVHQFKYKYKEYLISILSDYLLMTVDIYFKEQSDYVLVPIPLHQKRIDERGFNQAMLICETISKKRNYAICHLLKRTKETKQQALLNKKERKDNVSNIFEIDSNELNKLGSKNIILVDDIITSGETLKSAALTIKNLIPNKLFAITLSRGIK